MEDRVRKPDGVVKAHPPIVAATTPDLAICQGCLDEVLDPVGRRRRYPFASCPECGPRYTIGRERGSGREATTLAPFPMCGECERELADPHSRHFGDVLNSCPDCGPGYWIEPTPPASPSADVIFEVAKLLREGRILGIKDVGGFHLACLATEDALVRRLRRRKQRDMKPLAVMIPDLEAAGELAELSELSEEWLQSPAAPIAVVPKRQPEHLAPSVAPDCQNYGLKLPSTSFQHLLMQVVEVPIVLTSANPGGDALIVDNEEAREKLGGIADYLVLHDREIVQACDDSLLRVDGADPLVIRRSLGFAPGAIECRRELPVVLALGGILKSTIGLSLGRQILLSQQIGNLDNAGTIDTYHHVLDQLVECAPERPELVAHDLHPRSRGFQIRDHFGVPTVGVQHHHAHIAGVMAEHQLEGPVLGIALDSGGYGADGTVWGGEFLLCDGPAFERLDHAPEFCLPGGDGVIGHPWRTASGLLWRLLGEAATEEWTLRAAPGADAARSVMSMLHSGVGCVATSSLGRMYDAFAAIVGVCDSSDYAAQASLLLEQAAGEPGPIDPARFPDPNQGGQEYWTEVVHALITQTREVTDLGEIAAGVQMSVAHWVAARAKLLAQECGVNTVAASGGCLENLWLRHHLQSVLQKAGIRLCLNRAIPLGDGGLAAGQILVAAASDAELDTGAVEV